MYVVQQCVQDLQAVALIRFTPHVLPENKVPCPKTLPKQKQEILNTFNFALVFKGGRHSPIKKSHAKNLDKTNKQVYKRNLESSLRTP